MTVTVDRSGDNGLRMILLDRVDHRNAITGPMLDLLLQAFSDLDQDADARLVVLAAEGLDFCTGLDLDEFYGSATADESARRVESERLGRLLSQVHDCRIPSVSVVRGRAIGFGATLALSCDVTLASTNAAFSFPEVNFGFLPAFAARVLLDLTGPKTAYELLSTGRVLSGAEAKSLGIVSRLIPEEGFSAVSGSCLKSMAATAGSLVELKRLIREFEDTDFTQGMRIAADASTRARGSAIFREAAQQFISMG